MNASRSQRSDRGRRWLLRWAVPALLVGVAVQQMLWVLTADLDPWKGGGFGMFSKIETRILRAQVVRGEGPSFGLDLTSEDPFFERAKNRAITMPDKAALTAVAQAILDADFVPVDLERQVLQRELAWAPAVARPPGSWRRYRMRSVNESWLGDDEVVRFQKVRVQVWRFRFDAGDAGDAKVRSEPVGPTVELER